MIVTQRLLYKGSIPKAFSYHFKKTMKHKYDNVHICQCHQDKYCHHRIDKINRNELNKNKNIKKYVTLE